MWTSLKFHGFFEIFLNFSFILFYTHITKFHISNVPRECPHKTRHLISFPYHRVIARPLLKTFSAFERHWCFDFSFRISFFQLHRPDFRRPLQPRSVFSKRTNLCWHFTVWYLPRRMWVTRTSAWFQQKSHSLNIGYAYKVFYMVYEYIVKRKGWYGFNMHNEPLSAISFYSIFFI